MDLARAMIGIDAGGIYFGDLQALVTAAPSGQNIHRDLFSSPIRRMRQLGKGNGAIVDCDDGDYEIVVRSSIDHPTAAAGESRSEFFSTDEVYLRIASGTLTVGDVLCLVNPAPQSIAEMADPIARHLIHVPLPVGTYRCRLTVYQRCAISGEKGVRLIFSEEDHATWWQLTRDKIFGGMPESEFLAQRQAVEARATLSLCGVELVIIRSQDIPSDYDPGDLVLEIPHPQEANRILQREAKAKSKGAW
jgi:hypothetical protein